MHKSQTPAEAGVIICEFLVNTIQLNHSLVNFHRDAMNSINSCFRLISYLKLAV